VSVTLILSGFLHFGLIFSKDWKKQAGRMLYFVFPAVICGDNQASSFQSANSTSLEHCKLSAEY
jgi:hypothetical protein